MDEAAFHRFEDGRNPRPRARNDQGGQKEHQDDEDGQPPVDVKEESDETEEKHAIMPPYHPCLP